MLKKFLFFLTFVCLGIAKEKLDMKDARAVMSQLFSYHIEQKEMSKKILKRALINSIDFFDPVRLYLLQDEVDSILTLEDSHAEQAINEYHQDKFTHFEKIFDLFHKAVLRARNMRETYAEKKFGLKKVKADGRSTFSQSFDELKDRVEQDISNFFADKNLKENAKHWKRNMRFYNKKYHEHEALYLVENEMEYQEKKHLFTYKLLKALSKSLDPHTRYFSSKEARELRACLEKEQRGIGIFFKEDPDGIKVQSVAEKGPAFKTQKVKPGDVLIKINGENIEEASFDAVMKKLQEDDHATCLTFKRKDHIYEVQIKKEKLEVKTERVDVQYESVDGGVIGKLKLHFFYESREVSAYMDLKHALRELRKKGPLKGIVLDLRENPGGFLTQAIKVAGLFMKSGIICICNYANGEAKYLREVDGRSYFDGPLVILTSKFSASAAEIVAQSLQDYGLAVVVGDEHSFGKATIQHQTITDKDYHSSNNHHYYTVTIGRYYTVSGKTPQLEGVQADIVVPSRFNSYPIGERHLKFSLDSKHIQPHFEDQLYGVESASKKWYQLYYLPHLQKQTSKWTKALPQLREKSIERQKSNPEFHNYLQAVKKRYRYETDMQMEEAVNILKDMIALK
jgi:carboxyl-terminal processing protease